MQAAQRAMRAEDEDAMEAEAADQLTPQQLQAEINAAQDADLPTIMRALTKKGRNLLCKLSQRGLSTDEADEHGRTPLFIACQNGHVDLVRLLLDKGAEVDRAASGRWNEGQTPLYVACWKGHVDAARLLLDKGAEVDRAIKWADKCVVTPLHIACEKGHVDVVRLLLDKGAAVDRVDRADKYGVTPLYIACDDGHVDVVRLLLDKGAAVDLARWDGATPLSIAKYQGHSSIVALLEDHLYKADIDATAPVTTQTRGKNLANMMVDRLQSALDDEAARKRQRLGPRADMGRRLPRAGSDPRGRVAPAIRAAPAQIPEGTFVI